MRAIIALGLLVSGCSAHIISMGGEQGEFGPVISGPRAGIVRYLNRGPAFFIKHRRDDAYKKMFDSCAGKYRIQSEEEWIGDKRISSNLSEIVVSQDRYWEIKFECVGGP